MTEWETYRETARSKGVLALELFVVQSMPAVGKDRLREVLPEHLAYQGRMEKAGHLAFAGPLSDESGESWSGAGLIVYRAASLDAAQALAAADPMHESGCRTFTIRRWLLNEGQLRLTISLSTQISDVS
jgi:uncharacterized protein YciI